MLTSNILINILTPETIQAIGNEKLSVIKKLGVENSHFLVEDISPNPRYHVQNLQQKNKKIVELSNSRLANGFSTEEKILFCSQSRFPNDNKIIEVLNTKNISLDNINELNDLIRDFQKEQIKTTFDTVKLEEKYKLTAGQVVDIIKLYPSLLNNHFNLSEIDNELYERAKKVYIMLKFMNDKKDKKLKEIDNNETFKKLVILGREYFGLSLQEVYILINKINELVFTNENLLTKNTQKKLK